MTTMKLGSAAALMKRRLTTVTPYETVVTAAERMVTANLGALLVVDNDRLVGILSERDILQRVVARKRDPETTTVSMVLTPNPVAVTEDTPMEDCIQIIRQRGFRHLPVINAYRNPLGVIYSRDLLEHVLGLIEDSFHQEGDLAEILGPQKTKRPE
jgi:CBS domain-containing protein